MVSYLHKVLTETPQTEPLPGSNQVPNSAGGYSFAVDAWIRLDRFVVLGSEGGSYYASEQKLTAENGAAVLECIEEDGLRAVARIVAVHARAPKADPALFALALAASKGNEETRQAALQAVSQVARTGTHLLHFVAFTQLFRGWGRGLRRAVQHWLLDRDAESLAYQVLKYQGRDGWTMRDITRLSHPKERYGLQRDILHWVAKGWEDIGPLPHPVPALAKLWAFEKLKTVTNPQEAADLIMAYRVPREAIPTELLTKREVWDALFVDLGMTALLRNLATMTRVGTLAPLRPQLEATLARLRDPEALKRGRIHPIAVLSALLTYQSGRSARGSATWEPLSQIVDALDAAFYNSFGTIEPSGKRIMLALDVSGSMGMGEIAGIPGLTPRVGAAAMALVTAATESQYHIMAFADSFRPLAISPRQRLDDVIRITSNLSFGGTDCALPMLYAMEKGVQCDAFIVYTDSETWAGHVHPMQALQQYRQKTGIPAKLVVVGMVANQFSIADPNDAGSLDVVGFDAATPQLISDFVRGVVQGEVTEGARGAVLAEKV